MVPRSEAARMQRESRRRQLLDGARRAFADRGYHGASIADIIREADVARGTFYLYFESKRAIFDALVDGFVADVEARVQRIDLSPGAPPPLEQLNAILRRLMDLAASQPDLLRILLWEASGLDDASDEKLASFHLRMFALLRRSLDTGVSMGLVRPGDTDLMARCLLGSVKEVLLSLLVRRDLGERNVDHVAREMLDLALTGLLVRAW